MTDRILYPRLWQDGKLTVLGGARDALFTPTDLNNEGVVAGAAGDPSGAQHAAVWRAGKVTRLDLDSSNSGALAVNDDGMVVGTLQR